MRAAVLCNGPSKISYLGRDGYDYVIGCNIPWTKCDSTVIVDGLVVDTWNNDRNLVTVPVHYGTQAWNRARTLDEEFFSMYYKEVIDVDPTYHSSGHNAAEIMIRYGFMTIDIYGCDSWFNGDASSTTHSIVIRPEGPNYPLRIKDRVVGWKIRWKQMIENNPKVTINFIR